MIEKLKLLLKSDLTSHSAMTDPTLNKMDKTFVNPFRKIPNVKKFYVTINDIDPRFKKHGIKKRLDPILHYEKYNNKSVNRYLSHQIIRLNNGKTDPTIYFKLMWLIMKKSNSFLTIGIYEVMPNGHRKLPLFKLYKLIKEIKLLINKQETNAIFKRVYIPKNNGKYRGLGVPTLEGRVYLHLLNQFFCIFLDSKLHDSQHGFRPGRSTLTAGTEILEKVIKDDDIYEFDLKDFFPSLNILFISDELIKMKVPMETVYFIQKLNENAALLPHAFERKLNETGEELKNGKKKLTELRYGPLLYYFKENTYNHDRLLQAIERQNLRYRGETLMRRLSRNSFIIKSPEGRQQLGEFMFNPLFQLGDNKARIFFDIDLHKGVPQGFPTSPLLSNIISSYGLQNRYKSVMYADDGLVYGKELEITKFNKVRDTIGMVNSNMQGNTEKSGGVKQNGKGLKELKFLGLTYNGGKNTLRGSTHKGSKLKMDKQELIRDLNGELNSIINTKGNGENFIKSKIKGFIMSRLYAGSWNLEEFQQDFSLTFDRNTGVHASGGKSKIKLDIFNSSSIANRSLLNMLRNQRRWETSHRS